MLDVRRVGVAAIAAAVVLVAAGCRVKQERVALGFAEETSGTVHRVEGVEIVPVEVVEENEYIMLTGSLGADEKSDVASRVTGIVEEVLIDRGSIVNKGDVMVKLDPEDAQIALAEGVAMIEELLVRLGLEDPGKTFRIDEMPEVRVAKSTLDLAEANFRRDSQLSERNLISEADFDRGRSEYDGARQRFEQVRQQAGQLYQSYRTAQVKLRMLHKAVSDTSITAPFTGLVVEKSVAPGERVVTMPMMGAGGKVATIMRIDPLRLSLTVPEQYLALVREGQPVSFTVDAYQGRTFDARIRFVTPAVDEKSRSMTVEALVPNEGYVLKPGLFVKARLELPERRKAFYVPAGAVSRSGDVARVFVVKDNVARERVVAVAADTTTGSKSRVSAGLEPGDFVVADAAKVRDGSVVR